MIVISLLSKLNLFGIATSSHEGLDLDVLLQGFKEDLHLPTVFVDGGNGGCSKLQLIVLKTWILSVPGS